MVTTLRLEGITLIKGTYRLELYNDFIYIYDDSNNLIYTQSIDSWSKSTYNNNGNKTRYDNSKGLTEHYIYDDNNNLIKSIDNKGNWVKRKYNERGQVVQYRSNTHKTLIIEYDKNGNILDLIERE